MRSLITFTLSLGLITACGDKEEEDTATEEVVEETEETETTEESEDTASSEEVEETESEGEE